MKTKSPRTRSLNVITGMTLGYSLSSVALAADLSNGADNFYQSDKVALEKVTFKNQYQMTVVGNLFTPKNLEPGAKSPAIIVGHPMGAVKEQSSNLYAQKLAEQGFVTLAIDLPFWGESEGEPRNAVLPDVYAEAFSASSLIFTALPEANLPRRAVTLSARLAPRRAAW